MIRIGLRMTPDTLPLRWRYVLVIALVVLCAGGCVRRRMTIRSDPPGAMVYIDDYAVGTTPVSASFTYYGARKIRLVKDGFETLTVLQPFPTPWYEFPPLDFISENLVPGEIRDQRSICYRLRPQLVVSTPQLRAAAEDLRARGRVPLATIPSGFLSPVPRDPFSTPPPVETIPAPTGQPGQFQAPPISTMPGQGMPLQTAPLQTPPVQAPPGSTQPTQPFPLNAEPVAPGQPVGAPISPSPAWTPPPGEQ